MILRTSATVQPARLALGLRATAARGGRPPPRARRRARRLRRRGRGTAARHASARARPCSRSTARTAGFPGFRRSLAVASSHIVLTEPVPDVHRGARLDGRRGDRGRPHAAPLPPDDARRPDRVRLGRRADGLRRAAARPGSTSTRTRPRTPATTCCASSRSSRTRGHARLGRADRRLARRTCRSSARAAASITASASPGTASARRYLGGEILARLALDRRDELTRLATRRARARKLMPPEPFRWAGGSLIRAALVRRGRRRRRRAPPRTPSRAFVAGLPRRLGLRLPR